MKNMKNGTKELIQSVTVHSFHSSLSNQRKEAA